MSEDVVIEKPEPETPAQLPADTPIGTAPASDDLDQLLADFDNATKRQAESEPASDNTGQEDAPVQVSDSDLDKFIAELSGPSADQQRIGQLTGELDGLKAQIRAAEELKAFNEFAGDLQKQLPSWLPEDYARVKLESLAHDPVARLAWETRSIDPKAAAVDLAHVQFALKQTTDPKQVQELRKLEYQLSVAANSASILRQARNQIIKEANGLKPPIDPEATADRDAIAQAIREGQGPINVPDPPVQWGRLSGKEFREKVIRDHGFDPGSY